MDIPESLGGDLSVSVGARIERRTLDVEHKPSSGFQEHLSTADNPAVQALPSGTIFHAYLAPDAYFENVPERRRNFDLKIGAAHLKR